MQYLSACVSSDVRNFRKRHALIFVMSIFCFCFTPNAESLEKDSSKHEVSLTCMFSEDIGEKKTKFQIVDEQQDSALDCRWKEEELYCSVGQGYTYDWKFSDTVAVRKIPSQEPEPSTCSCFLIDSDHTFYERPCSIRVAVQEDHKEPPKTTKRLEDSDSQNSSTEQSEGTSLTHPNSQEVAIAVTLTVSVVLLIVLTAVAIVIHRRYSFHYCGLTTYAAANQSNPGDP